MVNNDFDEWELLKREKEEYDAFQLEQDMFAVGAPELVRGSTECSWDD